MAGCTNKRGLESECKLTEPEEDAPERRPGCVVVVIECHELRRSRWGVRTLSGTGRKHVESITELDYERMDQNIPSKSNK